MSAVSRLRGRQIVALWIALVLGALHSTCALAYIGPSFLQVPGIAGGWAGAKHHNWIRLEADYWGRLPPHPPVFEGTGRKRTYFSGPVAPRSGAGTLAISLDKRSPVLASLMAQCTANARIPELTFAESSDMARRARSATRGNSGILRIQAEGRRAELPHGHRCARAGFPSQFPRHQMD
jgi:hypothetical protein